jgi:cell division septal protein FtsQ
LKNCGAKKEVFKMRKYRSPRRIKRKTPFFKKKIFWIFFLFFLFFSGNFYLTIFSKFFQIQKIEISGSEKLKENVKSLVEYQLSKNLFSFQTKSIFLFDPSQIVKLILENFPQVEEIEFLKKFPDKLEINIKERKAIALFCSQKCYLIDSNGIAFEEFFDKEDFKIEKENKEEISLGQVVIDKETLNEILKIKKNLEEEFQIPLEKIVLVSEERINVKTREGWEIYFNPKRDIDWQLTKLKALFEKEIPPEKRVNLEYIELRFGNFAPYKYRY